MVQERASSSSAVGRMKDVSRRVALSGGGWVGGGGVLGCVLEGLLEDI